MAKNTQFIQKGFSELPPWAKGVISVGLLAGGAFIVYKLVQNFGVRGRQEIQENINIKDELKEELTKNTLSYKSSQYDSMANVLETAMENAGTDEETIFSIFRMLKNNADYLMLQKTFGKRKYSGELFGVLTSAIDPTRGNTLQQWLRFELSSSEIQKINDILKNRKITYRI